MVHTTLNRKIELKDMIRKGRIPSTDIKILEKLCNKSDDTYTHHPNLEIKKSNKGYNLCYRWSYKMWRTPFSF